MIAVYVTLCILGYVVIAWIINTLMLAYDDGEHYHPLFAIGWPATIICYLLIFGVIGGLLGSSRKVAEWIQKRRITT